MKAEQITEVVRSAPGQDAMDEDGISRRELQGPSVRRRDCPLRWGSMIRAARSRKGDGGISAQVMTEISVVIPTHNRSSWLALCLRSVLSQLDVDPEIIVVDDGSTDNTAEMVGALVDRRVRLIRHETPHGVSTTRNHGAAEASGEWLAFIDDDDLWAPWKLARQIRAAREASRAWVYTGSVIVDDSLRVLHGAPPPPPDEVQRLIPARNVIPGGGSNVVVLREAFERLGPFSPQLKNVEDWEMWIRLAKHGPPAWVPEPLVAYRVHSVNASLDIHAILTGISLIERWHGTRVDRGAIHRWIAESCLRIGRRGAALKHMALAALDGQVRPVAGDVATLLRRRVSRSSGHTARHAPAPYPDWIAQGEEWLRALVDP
jgi:hypothetical protein